MVRGKVRRLSTRAYSNNHHNPWYKIGPVGLEIIYICSKMLRNSSFHSLPGWVSLWMIRASKVSSNSKNFSQSCDKCTEEVLHSFSDNNSGCTIPSKDLWKKNIWVFLMETPQVTYCYGLASVIVRRPLTSSCQNLLGQS